MKLYYICREHDAYKRIQLNSNISIRAFIAINILRKVGSIIKVSYFIKLKKFHNI